GLLFTPRLPVGWDRLCFRLLLQGRVLTVEIKKGEATYTLDGAPAAQAEAKARAEAAAEGGAGAAEPDRAEKLEKMELRHYNHLSTLTPGEPMRAPIPDPITPPAPQQPHGREPHRR